MADNGFKINKSVNFNPQSATPANPVDGDFYYDSTLQTFAHYHNGSWANLNSVDTVATALWMTGAQFTAAKIRNTVLKVTGGVAVAHLAGMAASFSAKQITIYNAGSDLIVVEPDDANEPTVNNRIMTPTAGSMNLIPGEVAVFTYDIVASRWLLVSISSQAGAQVIATIANPGLVTLHQASLLPLDGVVLSDGDLNTATGVVGLDANRAALIDVPLAAVPALVVNSRNDASGVKFNIGTGTNPALQISKNSTGVNGISLDSTVTLTQKPGSDVDLFLLNNTILQLGKRQLKFSDNDGTGLHYSNYIEYTNLADDESRGMRFINECALGTAEFWVQTAQDSGGSAKIDLIFKVPSSVNHQQISDDQGNLLLNATQVNSTVIGHGTAGTTSFYSNSTKLWEITGHGASPSGALQATGVSRFIRNITNPTLAQDVATKFYVDQQWDSAGHRNLIINGHFRYWQRNGTGSALNITGSRTYNADRWQFIRGTGATDSVAYSRQSTGGGTSSRYAARLARTNGDTDTTSLLFWQEIDREVVRSVQSQKMRVSFRARCGVGYAATVGTNLGVELIAGTSETEVLTNSGGYTTGSTSLGSGNVSLTGSFVQYSVEFSTANLSTAASLGLRFTYLPNTTAVANDFFEITSVVLTTRADIADDSGAHVEWTPHGGSEQSELAACERHYEKSYEVDVAVATSTTVGTEWSGITSGGGALRPDTLRFRVRKWRTPTTYNIYSNTGTSGSVTDTTGATDRAGSSFVASETGFHFQVASSSAGNQVGYHYEVDTEL